MSTVIDDSESIKDSMGIVSAINALARLQGHFIDRLSLHHAVTEHSQRLIAVDETNWMDCLHSILITASIDAVEVEEAPDPARLPAVTWLPELGWGVVRSYQPNGEWLVDFSGNLAQQSPDKIPSVIRLVFEKKKKSESRTPVRDLFKAAFLSHKKIFVEGALAGALINLLALGTSLFSMQVYDRVIPTQGYSTLFVLTLGVALSVFFELIFKIIRSYLTEHAVVDIDSRISREIFTRLLHIRLDQMPSSVGSLSSQIRGYETIRGFLSSTTLYALVDVPFGVVFVVLIGLIGGFWLAIVPLVFLVISIVIGSVLKNKVEYHAKQATAAANLKTGILVETIEGAETIKAGGGGWGALSKWLDVVEESIKHELINRNISEKSGYFTALLQQVSYVGLVATGAYFAAEGQLTMGALIACSILSGRALAPIAQIPTLMTQRAHAKAALESLENIFILQTDNHNVDRPLLPDQVHGHYVFERVRFSYGGAPKGITIPQFVVNAGDKIGVIGPVGAGKSTLLRLLSGMYQVSEGRILLDGLDIDQIGRLLLSEKIGYLQQDHRLFNGTLRQNLLVGIPDPGDEVIRNAASKTGLLASIMSHPKGLDLMIAEGGRGLSGGQRQLVAFTRLLLNKPKIWLLDEPTASMDEGTEQRCLQILRETIEPTDTVVLVTHKPSLLAIVNRLVVVTNNQIVMDGPRDQVIRKLQENAKQQQEAAQQAAKKATSEAG